MLKFKKTFCVKTMQLFSLINSFFNKLLILRIKYNFIEHWQNNKLLTNSYHKIRFCQIYTIAIVNTNNG